MEEFFTSLETHYFGITILLLSIGVFVTWVFWIFSIGRFKYSKKDGSIFYVFADLIVKIINDFRHLLALILVIIFAASLTYSLYLSKTLDDLSLALQLVMSTLGGLVGSIVGYYFGESAVKRAMKKEEPEEVASQFIQEESEEIKAAPPPKTN